MESELSLVDRAYLAGILDGEGCLFFDVRGKKTGRPWLLPKITVANTKKPLIDWLSERYGGTVHVVQANKAKNEQTRWFWSVDGGKARGVADDAYPYLILKKENADLFSLTRSKGNGIQKRDGKGRIVNTKTWFQFGADALLAARMHKLNARGYRV